MYALKIKAGSISENLTTRQDQNFPQALHRGGNLGRTVFSESKQLPPTYERIKAHPISDLAPDVTVNLDINDCRRFSHGLRLFTGATDAPIQMINQPGS